MSKSSLWICLQVPCGMPHLPAISELTIHWSSLTIQKMSPCFHLYDQWQDDLTAPSPQCFRTF